MIYPPSQKPPIWSIDPGVVAYNCQKAGMPHPALAMPMWEGAGNLVRDYSRNGNHGTIHGADWVASGLDVVANNSDYIEVPYATELDFGANQDFTVATLIKTTQVSATGTWPTLVSHEDNVVTRQGYNLVLHNALSDDRWYFEFFRDGGGNDHLDGSTDIADGNWHFIVGIRKGTTIKTYEDGILANSAACSGASVAKNIPLTIGGMLKSGSLESWSRAAHTANGTYIFKTALSAAQVKFLYDNPYFMYRMPEELYGYVAGAPPTGNPFWYYNMLRRRN